MCIDVVTAVYETTFYDEICEGEYSKDSNDFKQCINKTSKIITVSVRIVSIVLQAYFVYITRKFIKLVLWNLCCFNWHISQWMLICI